MNNPERFIVAASGGFVFYNYLGCIVYDRRLGAMPTEQETYDAEEVAHFLSLQPWFPDQRDC